jgi:hypothetical protein
VDEGVHVRCVFLGAVDIQVSQTKVQTRCKKPM